MNAAHPDLATLLIVDDTPANLGVIVENLEDHGFHVVVAQDGLEGLQRAGFVRPDLILLDVMMPGLDGFETCRRLKAEDATREIPVIFMTALADAANKVAGFAAGGVDYVTKPFDFDEVLARVNTHLALRALQQRLETRNRELEAANCRLEETRAQLLQTEKMAAIGLLAAGVAHEINNPLGFVTSNLTILEEYAAQLFALVAAYEAAEGSLAGASPAQRDAIHRAREAADLEYIRSDTLTLMAETRDGLARVKKIVQNLRDFSHVGESEWQLANLNQGLESTLNIVWNELKYKARVTKDYGPLPEIECQPQELNQVFMNLLVNAAQAIPDRGEIRIRTWQEGGEVRVEIADTGSGIAPEHLSRIFDPFFTTKPVGSGTGLGLALSYATINKHHGRIEAASILGKGTTFSIRLPLRQPPAEAEQ